MSLGTEILGRLIGRDRGVRLRLDGDVIADVDAVAGGPDVWIAPGFVDIQVNGYAGWDVRAPDADADTIAGLVRSLWSRGVTALCPTVTTAPEERMVNSLRAVAAARAADPLVARAIPCAHVEGPSVSPEDGPRGAHNADYVRGPDISEFQRWQRAANGIVGVLTLAPEFPGSLDYIRAVSRSGVIVALGHTGARSDQIAAAVQAGATLSTHLGNGTHAMLRRHPNYLWDQLAEPRLMASFIADGHHLPASTFAAMVRAKGVRRSILISDSVALSGRPEGHYQGPMGAELDLTDDGQVRLSGTPLLAGGVRAQTECVGWAARHGLTLAAAVAMASVNPARLLRRLGLRRAIAPGAPADLTMFRLDAGGQMEIVATVVGGVVVHRSAGDDVVHDRSARSAAHAR